MRREICKFKTGSKKVLPVDSAAALFPPDPSHYRHKRPLDIQLTLPGHWTCKVKLNFVYPKYEVELLKSNVKLI